MKFLIEGLFFGGEKKEMKLEGLKINFLGDSITEGHGVSDPQNFYWRRFEKDGCICRGYGIGGTRIANQQVPYDEVMDRYFASRVDEMDADADVVVPDELGDHPVVSIYSAAFDGLEDLHSVYLPKSVRKLYPLAFWYCGQLETVYTAADEIASNAIAQCPHCEIR